MMLAYLHDYIPWNVSDTNLRYNNKIWNQASQQFGDELNSISLLQTVQKLKASVEYLVEQKGEDII